MSYLIEVTLPGSTTFEIPDSASAFNQNPSYTSGNNVTVIERNLVIDTGNLSAYAIPLTGSSSISGSLVPNLASNNYSIGSTTNYWNNGYFNNTTATSITGTLDGTATYATKLGTSTTNFTLSIFKSFGL